MTNVPSQKETDPGTIKHGQHLVAVPDDRLAVTVDLSSKHALSRRRQAKRYSQNCSGALRVSSSQQSTCTALQYTKSNLEIQNKRHSPDEWAS